MKKLLKKLIDTRKYKRIANSYKLKYESTLEEKLSDKEKIIKLQDQVITLQEISLKQKQKIIELQKNK